MASAEANRSADHVADPVALHDWTGDRLPGKGVRLEGERIDSGTGMADAASNFNHVPPAGFGGSR